jgi:hypothetical protein
MPMAEIRTAQVRHFVLIINSYGVNLFQMVKCFDLSKQSGTYLYHNSELGEFNLGSDAITHSYKNQKRKQWLIEQVSNEVDELFKIGSTIGAYTLFPKNKIGNKFTINQARGVNSLIDDRFDLTLECIKLFYKGQNSHLMTLFYGTNHFSISSKILQDT